MARIMALDLGDSWTGTALTDDLGMFATPYKTVATSDLEMFLAVVIKDLGVSTMVVGLPRTMRGADSQQTSMVRDQVVALKERFPHAQWVLQDERLTSKNARQMCPGPSNKEEKLRLHSVAATLILEAYLAKITFLKSIQDDEE